MPRVRILLQHHLRHRAETREATPQIGHTGGDRNAGGKIAEEADSRR